MCELQPADDISHRIQVWLRRLHLCINLDEAALSDRLGVLQANLTTIWHAAGGNNEQFSGKRDRFAAFHWLNLHRDPTRRLRERTLLDAVGNVDCNAALCKGARQLFGSVAVFERHKCWEHLDDGCFGAKVAEVGGELTANGATTNHDHAGRLERPRGDLIAINDHASIRLKSGDAANA